MSKQTCFVGVQKLLQKPEEGETQLIRPMEEKKFKNKYRKQEMAKLNFEREQELARAKMAAEKQCLMAESCKMAYACDFEEESCNAYGSGGLFGAAEMFACAASPQMSGGLFDDDYEEEYRGVAQFDLKKRAAPKMKKQQSALFDDDSEEDGCMPYGFAAPKMKKQSFRSLAMAAPQMDMMKAPCDHEDMMDEAPTRMAKVNSKQKFDYDMLISSQNFSGFWSVAELPLIEKILGQKVNDEDKTDQMITILVLEILQAKFADLKKEWRLIEQKANKWLKKNHKESLDELKEKVNSYKIEFE